MSHQQLEAELANFLKKIEIASWNRPRTSHELTSFIASRQQILTSADLA